MKLVIAGGRNYNLTDADRLKLDNLSGVDEVVSGGAAGADNGGELWAMSRGLKVTRFPADWQRFGKAAGHIRNAEMAEYADAAFLFPGGVGTANMRQQMLKRNKPILGE